MRPVNASGISGAGAVARRHGQHIAAFLCGLIAFAVFYLLRRGHPGFPLDDSWIHQTVARNLVAYRVYGFLPGVHSSGSSSVLWTGVIALKYALLPGVQPWVYSAALSGVFMGLICLLLKVLTEQDSLYAGDSWGDSRCDSWIVALAPCLSGNFLWLGLLGMEHVLFVLLSLAAIFWWFRRGGMVSAWAAALLMAVLTATRPEGLLLAGVLAVYAWRDWRRWAVLLLGAGCGMAFCCAVNWRASRTLLPLTMQGRKMFMEAGRGAIPLRVRMGMEAESLVRLLHVWAGRVLLGSGVLSTPTVLAVAFLFLLAAAAVGAAVLARRGMVRLSAMLAWMVVLNGVYLVVFPSEGHGGRHLPLQVLLFLPLLFLGVRRCLLWAGGAAGLRRSRLVATSVVGALMVVSTAISWRTWAALSRDGIDQIDGEHGAMAAWIVAELPPESESSRRIAAFDIGRIGYALRGSLVDLGGLTDPDFLPAYRSGRTVAYLQSRGVTYLVLPTLGADQGPLTKAVLAGDLDAFQLEPLKTVCFPAGPAWLVYDATAAAMPCQTAFAIRYR